MLYRLYTTPLIIIKKYLLIIYCIHIIYVELTKHLVIFVLYQLQEKLHYLPQI